MNVLKKLYNFFKDVIAPKNCYSCGKEGHFLCRDCFYKIGFFKENCYICKGESKNFLIHNFCKKDIYFDKIIILTYYKNAIIKKLIIDAKYYNKKDILKELSFFLGEVLFYHIKEKSSDLILIPTPMYFLKKIKRGYNQSEIMVKNIGNIYNLKCETGLFKKTKNTKSQSHLGKNERLLNLKGSIILNQKKLKNIHKKTCIIVDDVISTGATINELSKLLKNNGVKKVYGLTLASD